VLWTMEIRPEHYRHYRGYSEKGREENKFASHSLRCCISTKLLVFETLNVCTFISYPSMFMYAVTKG
jgi:hypothetical protein